MIASPVKQINLATDGCNVVRQIPILYETLQPPARRVLPVAELGSADDGFRSAAK